MKTARLAKLQKGFTLIELLVVIGILAILLAIVLIAINPARQFAQANNTKRSSDVQAILNAIHQYAADNAGALPPGITGLTPDTSYDISSTGLGAANATALCESLVSRYLAAIPQDPSSNGGANIEPSDCAATFNTGYSVSVSAQNQRVTLSAPNTQIPPGTSIITVTR